MSCSLTVENDCVIVFIELDSYSFENDCRTCFKGEGEEVGGVGRELPYIMDGGARQKI